MGLVTLNESILTAIAAAIRTKLGVETTYKPSQMATAIGAIPTYSTADNGKVVVAGALTAQTSVEKTSNGTYDTTTNNEVVVNVANSYATADEGKVVSEGVLVSQTSATKTANGTYTTTTNNEIVVAIPLASGEEF